MNRRQITRAGAQALIRTHGMSSHEAAKVAATAFDAMALNIFAMGRIDGMRSAARWLAANDGIGSAADAVATIEALIGSKEKHT